MNANLKKLQAVLDATKATATDFLCADKVFDYDAYRKNIAHIKAKQLPLKGKSLDGVVADVRAHIVPGSIHQENKNYIAFPDKGSDAAAQYAAFVQAIINQNLIADEKSSPTGTYIETLVISWLRELVGYKTSPEFPKNALELGGAFVPGGVMANTVGLLGARQRILPETKQKGLGSLRVSPKVFVPGSTMSHYSHFGATWWLGIGTENIVEIACTSEGRMDQSDLETQIKAVIAAGDIPVALVAIMGDSRTNTLEDLPGLYAITQRYGLWLHADACHGGVLAFDRKAVHDGRHILSYTDSITIDPHKHMSIPYANSVVLFKDSAAMAAIGSSTDITIAYGGSDVGQITPFLGSRGFDALKLYAVMEYHGIRGLEVSINKKRQIVRQWHRLLAKSDVLQPLHVPDLFAQAFSLRPNGMSPAELSASNKLLHERLYREGQVVVHMFGIRDYRNVLGYGKGEKVTGLGSLFGTDEYTTQDLKKMLAIIEATWAEVQAATIQEKLVAVVA